MLRQDVYHAINTERAYQSKRWGDMLNHGHEVGAWLTLVRMYLTSAEHAWAHNNNDLKALQELRKVAALVVACFEQHGVEARSPNELTTATSKRSVVSCKWCLDGYVPIRSSVSDNKYVHTDTPVGRVVCNGSLWTF